VYDIKYNKTNMMVHVYMSWGLTLKIFNLSKAKPKIHLWSSGWQYFLKVSEEENFLCYPQQKRDQV
jgi:hypothetical protein